MKTLIYRMSVMLLALILVSAAGASAESSGIELKKGYWMVLENTEFSLDFLEYHGIDKEGYAVIKRTMKIFGPVFSKLFIPLNKDDPKIKFKRFEIILEDFSKESVTLRINGPCKYRIKKIPEEGIDPKKRKYKA